MLRWSAFATRILRAKSVAAVLSCASAVMVAMAPGLADASTDRNSTITQGIAQRLQGNLNISIDLLAAARQAADDPTLRAEAAGELGASLLQARRYDEAEAPLREAYAFFSGAEKARYAIDLGNLAQYRKRPEEAKKYYADAIVLAQQDLSVQVSAGLNLARLAPPTEQLALLAELAERIDRIQDVNERVRYRLKLGAQARHLGNEAIELAYRNTEQARTLALQCGDGRLQAEALDALAQLYEDQGRRGDALTLTQRALSEAHKLQGGSTADLLINLEWRQGRLFNAAGNEDAALAAYQRAVDHIEAVRQDIPIENAEGKSSFRETLEPVYLGLAELLFRKAATQPASEQAAYLYRIRDTVELIKQSELQDYLGDRCEVEAIHNANRAGTPAGVAVLYPIILPDRTELLLETEDGISWRTSQVDGPTLRFTAVRLARVLNDSAGNFLRPAQKLYDWLLRPFEDIFVDRHIQTLVVVPDGALRLVSMSVLHDGKRFAIEKFAIATVTGLTMTNSDSPAGGAVVSLVAGMSKPGPVVDKLPQVAVAPVLDPGTAKAETSRGLGRSRNLLRLMPADANAPSLAPSGNSVQRTEELRKNLALPGVTLEIQALGGILRGTHLLNSEFTVGRLRAEMESGEYRIVHIASHGVFGGTADASYIMAYDDIVTMNGLQSLLRSEKFRRTPLELLSLSACETAEGDERSPLGISGVAIKARAKSVLGTLSPVEDRAARMIMESFYRTLTSTRVSKAQALQQAQIELIRSRELSKPYFWAPFVLIGNWL